MCFTVMKHGVSEMSFPIKKKIFLVTQKDLTPNIIHLNRILDNLKENVVSF